MKTHRRRMGIGLSALLFAAASAALAAERVAVQAAQTDAANNYHSTILVSNEEEDAPNVDPNLKNAWGIAAGPQGPWWVNNNGTNTSTLYQGDGTILPLVVSVPGAPTGIVFNSSASFQLSNGTPAIFIFDAEDGSISAWASGTAATVVHGPEEGSIYKGLAILGDTLYTTDFGHCEVEAYEGNFFDGTFDEVDTAGGFEDGSIPSGYCPFGIQAIGDSIFVTYALKEGDDDVSGQGHGFVRQFDADGNLVADVGSRGLLNSPWGLAMAPAEGFGKFSGCLIVGNFGDGHMNAFCQNNGGQWHHSGRLKEGPHSLTIDGLWGIGFGNDGQAGPSTTLYFAAGPDDEENGYYGTVAFEPK